MMIVAEQVQELLDEAGLSCKVMSYGVAGTNAFPPRSDLILQLLPAFTEAEAGCPVINVKPLIGDPRHPETVSAILKQVRADHPA